MEILLAVYLVREGPKVISHVTQLRPTTHHMSDKGHKVISHVLEGIQEFITHVYGRTLRQISAHLSTRIFIHSVHAFLDLDTLSPRRVLESQVPPFSKARFEI
jgi:hypothetical protein